MSRSSTLSMSVLLTLEMQLINGALFLKANSLSYALLTPSTVIVPSLQQYMHHCNYTNQILALMF